MRGKSGQSSQKFFRRTSRSPLDKSRVTSNVLNHPLFFDIKSPHNPSFTKLSTFQANDQKSINSTLSLHTVSPQNVNSPIVNPQLSRGNSQGFFQKDPQEMKLTYIPIQTTNTLQSIPTIPTKRKKGSQVFEHPLQTARSQQLVKLRKQVQNLKSQKFSYLKDRNTKDNEIQRLIEQNCLNKAKINDLQTQISQIKMKLVLTQKQFGHSQEKLGSLQLALEAHQLTIGQLNFKISELSKSLLEAQNYKNQNINEIFTQQRQHPSSKFDSIGLRNLRLSSERECKSKEIQVRSFSVFDKESRKRDEQELWSKSHDFGTKLSSEKSCKSIQTENLMIDQMKYKQTGKAESPVCKIANFEQKLKHQLMQIQHKDRLNQQLFIRIEEDQKLIQFINEAVMAQGLRKIATKYRTFRPSG